MIIVSILNGFLDHVLVSRLYPKQEHKQKDQQSITVQCASNMMQDMAWNVRYDVQFIWALQRGEMNVELT